MKVRLKGGNQRDTSIVVILVQLGLKAHILFASSQNNQSKLYTPKVQQLSIFVTFKQPLLLLSGTLSIL